MTMERFEVVSSVVQSAGHTRVLEIQFESGRVYQYYNVPKSVYRGFMQAESKGKYFNAHIRNQYPYQEIEVKHREQHSG